MALSPQLLALLEQQNKDATAGYMNPETGQWVSQSSGPSYLDKDSGQTYMTLNNSGYNNSTQGDGVYGVGKHQLGGSYDMLNAQGDATGEKGTYHQGGIGKEALMAFAAMVGAGVLGPGLMGAEAGSGLGTGNGAFLGEAAWTPTAAGGAGGTSAMGAAGASGAMGTMAPMELMTAGGGALPGAMSAGGAGASTAGGLLGQYGQYIAPLLGAVAGSQGQEQSSTSVRDVPELLKPYLLDPQKGLLPNAQNHFMSELQRMPAYTQQLRDQSQGLLSGTTKFGRG
jgi:hypothetical protein